MIIYSRIQYAFLPPDVRSDLVYKGNTRQQDIYHTFIIIENNQLTPYIEIVVGETDGVYTLVGSSSNNHIPSKKSILFALVNTYSGYITDVSTYINRVIPTSILSIYLEQSVGKRPELFTTPLGKYNGGARIQIASRSPPYSNNMYTSVVLLNSQPKNIQSELRKKYNVKENSLNVDYYGDRHVYCHIANGYDDEPTKKVWQLINRAGNGITIRDRVYDIYGIDSIPAAVLEIFQRECCIAVL